MTARDDVQKLGRQINQSIIGQENTVERLMLGILSNGHLLVEGLPGLAKTRAIKSLAKYLDAASSCIQFTPDLLPADITGSEIYTNQANKGAFSFQQGPIFASLFLADEINRAAAKVQSAVLEAMEERQVTVGGAIDDWLRSIGFCSIDDFVSMARDPSLTTATGESQRMQFGPQPTGGISFG